MESNVKVAKTPEEYRLYKEATTDISPEKLREQELEARKLIGGWTDSFLAPEHWTYDDIEQWNESVKTAKEIDAAQTAFATEPIEQVANVFEGRMSLDNFNDYLKQQHRINHTDYSKLQELEDNYEVFEDEYNALLEKIDSEFTPIASLDELVTWETAQRQIALNSLNGIAQDLDTAIDKHIETMSANHGMSDAAIEAEFAAQENAAYEEIEEDYEPISDEEFERLVKLNNKEPIFHTDDDGPSGRKPIFLTVDGESDKRFAGLENKTGKQIMEDIERASRKSGYNYSRYHKNKHAKGVKNNINKTQGGNIMSDVNKSDATQTGSNTSSEKNDVQKKQSFIGRSYYTKNAASLFEGMRDGTLPAVSTDGIEPSADGSIVMKPTPVCSYVSGRQFRGMSQLIAQKQAKDMGFPVNEDGKIYAITYNQAGEKNIFKNQKHFAITTYDKEKNEVLYYNLYGENAIIDKAKVHEKEALSPYQKSGRQPSKSHPDITIDARNPNMDFTEYLGKWTAATQLGARFVTTQKTVNNVREKAVKAMKNDYEDKLAGKIYAHGKDIGNECKKAISTAFSQNAPKQEQVRKVNMARSQNGPEMSM